MSAGIDLDNVCCDFGTFRAVDNANVSAKPGEFFSFLGPSGCGKATILWMVSGFIEPTEGTIRIGGKEMRGQRPNRRPTALIFQKLALFPQTIYTWFKDALDWNTGAAYSMIFLLVCIIFVILMMRLFKVKLTDIAK